MNRRIIFSADDFGGCMAASRRIADLADRKLIHAISIFGNCREPGEYLKLLPGSCRIGIHLDLTEGRPLSDASAVPLLLNAEGRFHNSFFRLLFLSIVRHREISNQVYREISAQMAHILACLPEDYAVRIDSHRHFHMIPTVFEAMCRALRDSGRQVEHIRFPAEQLRVFAGTPGVWRYIRPVNLLKVLVLKACGPANRRSLSAYDLQTKTALFCGVMFSGHMTEKELQPIGKKLVTLAQRKGKGMEFLFHPGYLLPGEDFPEQDNPFLSFYVSENRREEADALEALYKNMKKAT